LTGIFGIASAISAYISEKHTEKRWEVGSAAITFSFALLLALLIGLDASRGAKEYQFCLKTYADPKVGSTVLNRISSHCDQHLPRK